jgi:sphinganine-1-phosphate aldolase
MNLFPYAHEFPVQRTLPDQGRPRSEVLDEIVAMATREDARAHDGYISGSVYSGDVQHYAFLTEVFGHFGHANVLQRDLYPSATKFEGELIAMVAGLFGAQAVPGGTVCGVVTSGGTESLMNPLLAAREAGRERGVQHPNLVMPTTAHPALLKGAHYFGVEARRIAVTADQVADVDAMIAATDDDTVMLVGSAGTYPHGLIDPIEALSAVAVERQIPLHVDACLGGFVLCFGRELGIDVPPFDFSLPGVTSISADTHKYGFGLKGSSVLLYRTAEARRHQYFAVNDWPGGLYTSPGMSGSRSGGIIAAAWAAMVTLGRSGYLDIARSIFETAARLRDIIETHDDLRVIGDPLFNVAFTHGPDAEFDIFHVNDALAERGWRLNGLQSPPAVHFCITRPNTAPGVMDRFATDLDAAVIQARQTAQDGQAPRSGAAYGAGGASVPAHAVTGAMVAWLDATQDLPR